MQKSSQPNIIPAEDITEFSRWTAPDVVGTSVNARQMDTRIRQAGSTNVQTPVTAQNVEEIREAAYAEGMKQGRIDGKAEFKSEKQHILDHLTLLLERCHKQATKYDKHIYEQLVTLTISVAKQVIRRQLSVEPEQIMAVIREAINCLPSSSEKIILKLHPEDAALVRDIYHINEEPERNWKIFEDSGMQRGGCIIQSESSVVNADLDHRMATIVNKLLGGERSDD